MVFMGILLATSLFGCSCSKKEFTVTFITNGGTAVSNQTVSKDSTISKPTDPTKEGYEFNGWLLNGEPFDFTSKITGDITLEASWIEIQDEESDKFTVTFNVDGKIEKVEVENGKKVSKPTDPTKEGYEFLGWYLADEEFDFNTAISKDITLVANFEKIEQSSENVNKYTITFNSNGGSSVAKQTVVEGSTVKKPTNPTKSGYTFVSWQLNGKDYNFSTKVTGNITLVAKWIKNEDPKKNYTITFNSNGGSSVAKQTVVEGSTVKKPANPTKSGYTFVSWQLNGKDYNFSTKVTGNITLVAKWEKIPDTYTIKFIKYDQFSPTGTIQVFKNGVGPIEFSELLNSSGNYVGKYNSEEKGMRNANNVTVSLVAKVKLPDGTIVNIK